MYALLPCILGSKSPQVVNFVLSPMPDPPPNITPSADCSQFLTYDPLLNPPHSVQVSFLNTLPRECPTMDVFNPIPPSPEWSHFLKCFFPARTVEFKRHSRSVRPRPRRALTLKRSHADAFSDTNCPYDKAGYLPISPFPSLIYCIRFPLSFPPHTYSFPLEPPPPNLHPNLRLPLVAISMLNPAPLSRKNSLLCLSLPLSTIHCFPASGSKTSKCFVPDLRYIPLMRTHPFSFILLLCLGLSVHCLQTLDP